MWGWEPRKAEGGKVPQVGSHCVHWTCPATGETQRRDTQELHREFKKFPEEIQRRHCNAFTRLKKKKETIPKVSIHLYHWKQESR